jgi:hypothetical protein
MVAADLGRALLLALVPVLAGLTLWVLYPVVVVLFGLTLLFDTAARASLPDIVPQESLLGANVILNTIDTAGDLFYIVGGALVVVLGQFLPFYVDAASFLFSAVMVSAMRFPVQKRDDLSGISDVVTRIREGVSYLLANPFLKWTTVAFTVVPFAGGGVVVLTPLYADHTLAHTGHLFGPLRDGVFRFSVLEVTLGLGAVLGGAIAVRLARWTKRGTIVGLGFSGVGLSYCSLALTQNLYVAAGVTACVGLFSSLFVVTGMTLTQELTPSELRGRILAARVTLSRAALALGAAAAGLALMFVSYDRLWLVTGALIILGSLSIWLHREVREAD